MYSRIQIKNFRGLQDLAIEDLGRVNLFVGPNNIGKTSLLEACWLLNGPTKPQLTLNLSVFRGLEPPPRTPYLLWHGLFYDTAPENEIGVEGLERSGDKHKLRIILSMAGSLPVREGPEASTESLARVGDTAAVTSEVLQFEYTFNDNQVITARGSISGGLGQFEVAPGITRPNCVFLSARRRLNEQDLAGEFTKVQDGGRLSELVKSLQLVEPTLETLSLGFIERPLIRGHLGLARPLPLPIMGGGIVRLTEVLLSILAENNGIVLIDEFENGLYHRNMEAIWKAVDIASYSASAQVLATTHSQECVQAAVAAFAGEHAADFRLHRLERKKGQVHVVTYDRETAAAALEMNLEVR